ncbi:ABC transporter substrate-binding protein [Brevibacillus reuszeri]|uniref:ABC transporter substrate-binding protein n=1 Tax=Brevibacillus reuszeri TaxID=54915 RepID=A0ABQ0TR35_9BACL|nr:ABC transporter substrate-binding protein [Brevibacillus reuszeri]MED1861453.1 ABC transporter substrate-binding protein [Brevibacillus reuszeri]GED69999.1 ABC transporter substrate-binding protein [Brevibacillus reuszeri]
MKRKTIFHVASSVSLAITVFVSGCSSAPSSSPGTGAGSEKQEQGTTKVAGPKSGGTLTYALYQDIVSLDPAFTYDFSTVVNQITEGLLKFDENSKLVPSLAEKWENPDPKTYLYHIRKGVSFSDGTPMTVDDVIFSMERTRDPKTASYLGWMYGNVDKIEKVDDSTVKVTLKEPDSNWRYAMATPAGHVISKAYYEAHASNFGKPDGGVMGTGPFKYVSWQTGSEIVLEKNTNYWDKTGGPYLDKIVYKVIPEAITRVTGLKTGQINMAITLPIDLQEVVEKMDSVKISRSDSFLSDFVAMNTQRKPFDDVKVRQAINFALDKQKIVKEIIKDAGVAGKSVPVPPALWLFEKEKWEAAYNEIPDYSYDMEKAKQLLAESSVPNGFNGKILVDGDSLRMNIALALQAAVKPLGINLEVEKVTGEELNTRSWGGARDYDMLIQNWNSDFPDPSGSLQPLFLSANAADGGSNFANYKNPEVDKLLIEQGRLTDDTKRSEMMIQAEKLIAGDAPWIVVSHQKHFMITSKNVAGYEISPMVFWQAIMKDVYFTE